MTSTYKKLNYLYTIIETFNAGIILEGWEVPSMRQKGINLSESYIVFKNDKLVIRNSIVNIKDNVDDLVHADIKRDRELLLTKQEIKKIKKLLEQKGLTAIPAKVYLNNNNLFKCEVVICRGKKLYDRRQDIKIRDLEREENRY